jgi:hypothetical protein
MMRAPSSSSSLSTSNGRMPCDQAAKTTNDGNILCIIIPRLIVCLTRIPFSSPQFLVASSPPLQQNIVEEADFWNRELGASGKGGSGKGGSGKGGSSSGKGGSGKGGSSSGKGGSSSGKGGSGKGKGGSGSATGSSSGKGKGGSGSSSGKGKGGSR